MVKSNKITSVSAEKIEIEMEVPLETALGEVKKVENILIEIETEKGVKGVGIASPADRVTGETVGTALGAIDKVKNLIEDEEVKSYRKIHNKLSKKLSGQRSVIAGVEIALFDAICKEKDMKLSELVGGSNKPVETDYTIMIGDKEETKEEVEKALDAGFEELKIKIGKEIEKDVEKLEMISDMAPEADLKVDANQGYTVKEAIRFDRKLREKGIELELFEQPVHHADFQGLKEVKDSIETPVAADESLKTREDAAKLASMNAADIYNIKLMKSGVVEALDIISIAQSFNKELMIGCMAESTISIQAAAHIVSGTGAFDYVDLDAPFFLKEKYCQTDFKPQIKLEGPGTGIEID
jgi:L-alanine-DL-glutamate epimerase-like enolase superfamily enzyme